jgi:hypothetical protein
VAFDIDFAERTIKASMEAALKRMRQADEKLERVQRAQGDKDAQLAQALEEYNRCLAELVDYLNVPSRSEHGANKEGWEVPIDRSAWKVNSKDFAFRRFWEVRIASALNSFNRDFVAG